jgi:L-iditol 2-dehydrogenase
VNEYRLNAAKKFGADVVINAKENVPDLIRKVNDGKLADRVIVSTGALSAIEQSMKTVKDGGGILFFAPTNPNVKITIPFNEFWSSQVTLTSIYAAAPVDIKEAIELILSHKVNVHDMITHRLSLAETGKGFQIVADAKESIKVIIEPQR